MAGMRNSLVEHHALRQNRTVRSTRVGRLVMGGAVPAGHGVQRVQLECGQCSPAAHTWCSTMR
eukprot:3941812-Rhodomonas_salina.6